MARVLAAKADGRLAGYVWRWPVEGEKIRGVVEGRRGGKFKEEDMEKWLRVTIPALEGPYGGRPWVKHVLREAVRHSTRFLVG
ncbi:MAG: hypothetical protein PWQ91_1347 [Eubacteriales bacterium]|nr:hypothetical protein [Eubacteriales bacterium]MDN5364285.1 hypothetical protein [Eubacteriales bacterium]